MDVSALMQSIYNLIWVLTCEIRINTPQHFHFRAVSAEQDWQSEFLVSSEAPSSSRDQPWGKRLSDSGTQLTSQLGYAVSLNLLKPCLTDLMLQFSIVYFLRNRSCTLIGIALTSSRRSGLFRTLIQAQRSDAWRCFLSPLSWMEAFFHSCLLYTVIPVHRTSKGESRISSVP